MKCSACNNKSIDGVYCRNLNGRGEFYDCADFIDGSWMLNWLKHLQKKDTTPYISDFCKWSRNCLK